jgi:hypothetical protein
VSSTFHMRTRSLVAPAMNAPSGVKESANTLEGPIVIEHFCLLSEERAFHMLIAPSSLDEANNLSLSSPKVIELGNGCHIREVISPV